MPFPKRQAALLALFLPPIFLCVAAMRPTLAQRFASLLEAQADLHPAPTPAILTVADIKWLPAPVQRYVTQSGALGRPIPWDMRLEFDAVLRKRPGSPDIPGGTQQLNYFDPPTRSFTMKARMWGLPVSVLHHYADDEASMEVRVLGLFDAVDVHGKQLFQAECVTVLNDWCIYAPGRLSDPRLAWKALDAKRAEVAFSNRGVTVKAVLHFNERGELVDFVSDDRLALQDDGSLKGFRFSTPLGDYQDFGGMRLARKGEAVWHYPEGDFAYGSFTLKKVEYNR